MAAVEVTAQRLWQFGAYLNGEVWNDFHTVVRDQAGLQGSVDWLHGKADFMLDAAVDRVHGVSNGLISSAYSYAGMDQHGQDRMNDVPDNHRPRDPQPSDGKGIVFTTEGSPFHNATPIAAKSISVEGNSITEDMGRKAGGDAAAAVNWLVKTFSDFLGLGGKDLRQLVVEPLAGNYNRIRANGEAWSDVGTMLNTILTNFGGNAKKLVLSDWTGDAAQAFLEHVDVIWAGGLYVASKCAEWLHKADQQDNLGRQAIRPGSRPDHHAVGLDLQWVRGLSGLVRYPGHQTDDRRDNPSP